jgi:hypothetical protein
VPEIFSLVKEGMLVQIRAKQIISEKCKLLSFQL